MASFVMGSLGLDSSLTESDYFCFESQKKLNCSFGKCASG